MNKTQILTLLQENRNERGIANWQKDGHGDGGLKSCGWGLLYELSKKNPRGMDDDFLMGCIERVGKEIDGEPTWVRMAMGGALVGIGKRNKELNRAAVRVAKQVGPIDFSDGSERKCDPCDSHKHLTSDYLKKKLAG